MLEFFLQGFVKNYCLFLFNYKDLILEAQQSLKNEHKNLRILNLSSIHNLLFKHIIPFLNEGIYTRLGETS